MAVIPEPAKHFLSGRRIQSVINVFVVITLAIGLFASLLGVENSRRQASYTACLARYNNASQNSQQARSALNQEQIDVTNQVILRVATAKTQADVVNALADFQADQAKIAQEKTDHPIPAPPSEVCR